MKAIRQFVEGGLLFVVLMISLTGAAHSGRPAVAQANPVPLVNTPLVPDSAPPGSPDVKVTVSGTGFVDGAVVQWNGSPLVTTFVSGSQLTAIIPASDLVLGGTESITVENPAPGGGTSNVAYFQVRAPFSAASFGRSMFGVGSFPVNVATTDLRGNGQMDVIVVNFVDSTVSVLLGNGDGTFQTQTPYPVPSDPFPVAVGDFNGDGKPDLAVATEGGTLSILLGNGDGTLQPRRDFDLGDQGIALATGDFNRDGELDIAVALGQSGQLGILLGNGDGTFRGIQTYAAVGNRATGIAVGDFNGDGALDAAITGFSDSVVVILLGNGDGTFQSGIPYSTWFGPEWVTAADFNGDGKLDLAVQTSGGPPDAASVLLGNGDGTFKNHIDYPTHLAFALAAADLRGDGKLDLVVANYGGSTLSTLLGRGDGTFRNLNLFAAGDQPETVAIGDFNGDGRLDLATANPNNNTVSVLLQTTAVLSRTFVGFGKVKIGDSANQKVQLSNIGTTALTIESIGVTGKNKSEFRESSDCTTVQPGASCQITITFKPKFAIKFAGARIKVTDSVTVGPQKIFLVGRGVN